MDILIKALGALWQVALVGLLLGAGLPALFALGVRSLNSGRVPVTAGGAEGDHLPRQPAAVRPARRLLRHLRSLAVLFGIVVIVFGKQLFGV